MKKIQVFFHSIIPNWRSNILHDRFRSTMGIYTLDSTFLSLQHVVRTRRCSLRGQEKKGYGKVDGFELTGDGRRTNYFLHIRRDNRNREKWVRSVFSFDLRSGLIAFFFGLFPFFSSLISAKSHLRRFIIRGMTSPRDHNEI